jgi:hypothetical protein
MNYMDHKVHIRERQQNLHDEAQQQRLAAAKADRRGLHAPVLARLGFNTLGLDDDPAPIKEGFEQARGFFRSRVASALQLRRVPELRFRHDTSARRAVEVSQLIDDARGTGRSTD